MPPRTGSPPSFATVYNKLAGGGGCWFVSIREPSLPGPSFRHVWSSVCCLFLHLPLPSARFLGQAHAGHDMTLHLSTHNQKEITMTSSLSGLKTIYSSFDCVVWHIFWLTKNSARCLFVLSKGLAVLHRLTWNMWSSCFSHSSSRDYQHTSTEHIKFL
jgi:hypothetical protein